MDFKVAKYESLDEQSQDYKIYDTYIDFFLEGKKDDTKYNLNFKLDITKKELKALPQNEEININEYVYKGDTVLGVNGVFSIFFDGDFTLYHYLDNKFLIKVSIKDEEYASDAEIYFDI